METKKKTINTKTWIIIFAALAIICVIAAILIFTKKPESNIAVIIQDGKIIKEIDLNAVEVPYEFSIEAPGGGYNTISVKHGGICVSESDCRDQICVNEKWLLNNDMPIVCMPHKLMIKFKNGSDEVDAIVK